MIANSTRISTACTGSCAVPVNQSEPRLRRRLALARSAALRTPELGFVPEDIVGDRIDATRRMPGEPLGIELEMRRAGDRPFVGSARSAGRGWTGPNLQFGARSTALAPRVGRMGVLAVGACRALAYPAVGFEQGDHLANLHRHARTLLAVGDTAMARALTADQWRRVYGFGY
jgi:hypothetical protein